MSPWEEVEADPEFSTLAPTDKATLFDNWHQATVEGFHNDLDPEQIDSAGMRGFLASGQAKRRQLLGEQVTPEQAAKEFDQGLKTRTEGQQKALKDYDELETSRYALKDAAAFRGISSSMDRGLPIDPRTTAILDKPRQEAQAKVDEVKSRFAPDVERQAKEARAAIRGEIPVAVLGGDIYTDPTLTLDKEAYRKAVQSTDAPAESKLLALAEFNNRRDKFAKDALRAFTIAGDEAPIPGMVTFPKWESTQPAEVRAKSPEAKVLDYLRVMKDRPAYQKLLSAVATGAVQGGADVASQGIGLAAMTTGSDALAKQAGQVEEGNQTISDVQKLEGDNEATGATTVGGISRMGVGMTPAIGAGLLSGGSLTAAALAAGAQTAGAQFPTTYNAMIEQGKTPEEALSSSRGAALLSGAITAGMTAMGGKSGVEAILRTGGTNAARSKLKSVLLTGPLKEIIEEMPDEQASQIIEASLTNPDKPVSQVVDEFLAKAPDLALQVGILGGVGEVFSKGGKAATETTPAEQQRTPVNSAGLGRTVAEVTAESDALSAQAYQQAVDSGSTQMAETIVENAAAPTPEADKVAETGTTEPVVQEPGAAREVSNEAPAEQEVKATDYVDVLEKVRQQEAEAQAEEVRLAQMQAQEEQAAAQEAESRQKAFEAQQSPQAVTTNDAATPLEQGGSDAFAGESRTPPEGSIPDVTVENVPDNKPLSTGEQGADDQVTFTHSTKTEPGKGQQSGYFPGTYAYEDGTPEGIGRTNEGKKFTGTLKSSEIYTVQNADQLKKEAAQAGFGFHSGNGNAEVEYLKSLGYKAMRRGSTGGTEIIVFDPNQAGFKPAVDNATNLQETTDPETVASQARQREREAIGQEKAQRGDEKPITDSKAPVAQGEFVTWQAEDGTMREGVITKTNAGRNGAGEAVSEVTLESSEVVQVPRRELQAIGDAQPSIAQEGSLRSNPIKDARAKAIADLRGSLGQVVGEGASAVDAINAVTELQGQVPGVQKAWVGTRAEFLEDEKLTQAFPEVTIRIKDPKTGHLTEGLHHGGRAFVFTDQVGIYEGDIATAAEQDITPGQAAVQRVITHEALVHRGFYGLDAPTRRALFQWGAQNIYEAEMDAKAEEAGYGSKKDWRTDRDTREFLMEEIMAKMIERLKTPPKSGPLKQLWDILAAIWRKISGKSREVTLKDVQDVAKLLRTALELAENNVETRSGMPIKVDVARPSMKPEEAARDAEYMAAVEAGDMETAQRMVDEAAKAAGYNVGPVWRGDKDGSFTTFDPTKKGSSGRFESSRAGFFFTPVERFAKWFGPDVRSFYLKADKTLIAAPSDENQQSKELIDGLIRKMKDGGYDSIKSDNGYEIAVVNPSQIKSAGPITRDAEGNVIPLSQRFNNVSDDIRFSIRPQYTYPLDQTLANTAKAVRLMRDGPPAVPVNLQQVYQAAVKGKPSTMVSLDDLFATAKQAHPELTEAEFGQQVQSLYDDNGAYIEPAESVDVMKADGEKYGVRVNGVPASFVMVLDEEAPPMASLRPETITKLNRVVEAAQNASGDITDSEQTPIKDRPTHTFAQQSGEARVDAAVQIVDALEAEGTPKEELVDVLTGYELHKQLGIEKDPDMLSILLAEAMRRGAPGAFDAYEVTRERAGRALGSGAMLHSHPRYQHLFVLNGIKKEHQQQATDIAEANADIKDTEIKKVDAESNQSTGKELAESAEEAAFRQGEESLSAEDKPLWQKIKDRITRIGFALQKLAGLETKSDTNTKASLAGNVSSAELAAMDKMTAEQLRAFIADEQKALTADLKKMMGKGPKAKANPQAGRIATLVNRLSEQLGVPTDITTAVEALTASQDNIRDQYRQLIADSLTNKVRAATTTKKGNSKQLLSTVRQITRILADNLNLPKNTAEEESLGEKAIDAFGRVRNNEQMIREAWEKARKQILSELSKQATKDEESLTEEEAAEIGNLVDEQIASIAAEVPARLWARGQAFRVLRDALADTTFDTNAQILADPAGALKAAQDKIDAAVKKVDVVGDVNTANWSDTNGPFITAAFNQLVEDLQAAKAKSDKRRRAAQKAGVFSPAEAKTFNRLMDQAHKRSGDKSPMLPENISWTKLFSGSPQSQEAKAKQMMEYMKEDPVLSNLTPAEQQELADMFSKRWEAKREELTAAKVAAVLKRRFATEKGKQAVKGAIPKFIQAINRGELNNDIIAQDIAEKFGFEKLTDAENKKLETLAKELQEPNISVHDRRAKTDEIVKIIARKTGLSTAEILSAWWVTSVLSGPRTIFTIGMAFLSGGFEVFTHAAATVINAHLQGRRGEGTEAAMQSLTNYFKSYPRAVQLAWQYVRTGDKNLLADSDPAFMQFFDTGRNNPQSIGWRMTQSKNPATRMLGRFMHFFEKMLTAGDLFNSTITRHGMLPVAQFLNSKTYEKARVASETDLSNYRKKALRDWWGDEEPKTWKEQALVTRQSIDLMEAVLAKYANVLEDSNFVAAQGAMTLNPEGLGGKAYRAIRGIANRAETSSAKATKAADMLKAEKVGAVNKKTQQVIAFLYHFATHQMLNLGGLRFARFAGNKLNQSLGFIPMLGLARLYEKDYAGQMKQQAIIKNQVIGAVIAMVGITILKAISDEPDDDKRGWGIEGSWAGLSAAKIKQLMAAGRKQNSFHFGGNTFNYANWPISSMLAAIGAMADRIKYDPEDWEKATTPEVAYTGLWAAMSSTFDTTALSQLSEILGSNVHSRDPVDASMKKVSRVFGNFAGGFIPRVLKDIDLMGDGSLRKYEGWENFAKEVPYYRRYVGGPLLDIFAQQVEVSRTPWSREYQDQPAAREYQLLGQMGSNGLWLTPADPGNRRVGKGRRSREMTDAEQKRFVSIVGENYRQLVLKHGDRLNGMKHEAAKDMLGKLSDVARDRAERAALAAPPEAQP